LRSFAIAGTPVAYRQSRSPTPQRKSAKSAESARSHQTAGAQSLTVDHHCPDSSLSGGLPRERYKLYDKAVETLLTSWDNNKELSNQTVLKYLQLDDLRRLMESLAYWIHTQGNTSDTEGGTLIDKDELIQKLCQEIKRSNNSALRSESRS
jgi:predicted NACHT family NTPase